VLRTVAEGSEEGSRALGQDGRVCGRVSRQIPIGSDMACMPSSTNVDHTRLDVIASITNPAAGFQGQSHKVS
jgi:hypothetical protein